MSIPHQTVRDVVERIEQAASRVTVEGQYRADYFNEGYGHHGVFILFFKPAMRPNFVVTVRFNADVPQWGVERIAEAAEAAVVKTMAAI